MTANMCPQAEPRAVTIDVRVDDAWRRSALIDDIRQGFQTRPRRLPPRWLYDDRGSALYDQITRLAAYYPTEAERAALVAHAADIVERSHATTIIELGSGTSDKTRTLLDAFDAAGQLTTFVPFDVSESTLVDAANEIAARYRSCAVHAVVGDFHEHLDVLPRIGTPMLAFLGSTIGNLYPAERARFLRRVGDWLPAGGTFLLGVDLVKPVDRIVTAYNDPGGLTAAFVRNVLCVVNREAGADFDPSRFEYVGLWDPRHTRVDLRLRCVESHTVRIPDAGTVAQFDAEEELHIEISTKFTPQQIKHELDDAGLYVDGVWTDAGGDVALVLAARR